MSIEIIAAVSIQKNGGFGIGYNGGIPWKLPEDLKTFKEKTLGNTVVMGMGTFKSLDQKCLPYRKNMVLTRKNVDIVKNTGAHTVSSFKELDDEINLRLKKDEKIFIIGGESLYKRYRDKVSKIHLTLVDKYYDCDTYFPGGIDASYEILDHTLHNGYTQIIYNKAKTENNNEANYLKLLKNVLDDGVFKPDRTGTGVLSLFSTQTRFSLVNNVIPLLTTKKVPINMVIEELLWFCRGETDSNILKEKGVNIWNDNSSEAFLKSRNLDYKIGECGPIYGWQWRRFNGDYPSKKGGVDQLAYVENLLKTDPFSRRIMISSWNPEQLNMMVLPPCHFCIMFYVEEIEGVKYLSGNYIMRSNDLFLGAPFNIASYAILINILAYRCGMIAKELVASVCDAHIYSNHLNAVHTQLAREPRAQPILLLDDSIKEKTWEEISINDIKIVGYFPHPRITAKMAV
jgi:thymidylate synthase